MFNYPFTRLIGSHKKKEKKQIIKKEKKKKKKKGKIVLNLIINKKFRV